VDCHCDGIQSSVNCELHPFRMGRNPNVSEELRAIRREQAKKRGFGKKEAPMD
jgi:hypothetical protein